jgi:hypothetical protein
MFEEIHEGRYEVDIGRFYQVCIDVRKIHQPKKYHYNIRCFPSLKIPPLKLRAERMTREELDNIPSLSSMPDYLYDGILDGALKNILLIGNRGVGKTFTILKMARRFVKDTNNFIPLIYRFHGDDVVSLLSPEKYGSREEWGERYKYLSELPKELTHPQKIFEELEGIKDKKIIFTLDDVHFMFEGVMKRKIDLNYLIGILKSVRDLPAEASRILLSDDFLVNYAERFNNRELDEILFNFGEIVPRLRSDYRFFFRIPDIIPNRKILEPPTKISKLIDTFGMKFGSYYIDGRRKRLVSIDSILDELIGNNPRRVLRFSYELINFMKKRKSLYEKDKFLINSDDLRMFFKAKYDFDSSAVDDLIFAADLAHNLRQTRSLNKIYREKLEELEKKFTKMTYKMIKSLDS